MTVELEQIFSDVRTFKCFNTESVVELFNQDGRMYVRETSMYSSATSGKKRINAYRYSEILLSLTK